MPEEIAPVRRYAEPGWDGWYQDFAGVTPVPRRWQPAAASMPDLAGLPAAAAKLVEAAIAARCTWLMRTGTVPGERRADVTVWIRKRPYRHMWENGRLGQNHARTAPRVLETIAVLASLAARAERKADA